MLICVTSLEAWWEFAKAKDYFTKNTFIWLQKHTHRYKEQMFDFCCQRQTHLLHLHSVLLASHQMLLLPVVCLSELCRCTQYQHSYSLDHVMMLKCVLELNSQSSTQGTCAWKKNTVVCLQTNTTNPLPHSFFSSLPHSFSLIRIYLSLWRSCSESFCHSDWPSCSVIWPSDVRWCLQTGVEDSGMVSVSWSHSVLLEEFSIPPEPQ